MKKLCNGFFMSLSMFSTIPVPFVIWDEAAMCFIIPMFPVVGCIIGLLWYGLALLLAAAALPLLLQSTILMLCPLFLSGFIHIDGYMDTSDAIFSRASLEKKREILKDSHVGAFAVIALAVLLLLLFSAVHTVLQSNQSLLPLLFIPVLSRTVSGLVLLGCKPISASGSGAGFRQNTGAVHWLILLVLGSACFVAAYLLAGVGTVCILLALLAGGALAALYTVRQLGGISGDLCGFISTISELAALLFWACYK